MVKKIESKTNDKKAGVKASSTVKTQDKKSVPQKIKVSVQLTKKTEEKISNKKVTQKGKEQTVNQSKSKAQPENTSLKSSSKETKKLTPKVVYEEKPIEYDSSEDLDLLSNDEVYDEGDQAQWVQLAEQAALIKRARELNAPQSHPDFDGVHCIDCDAEIPDGRLMLGKIRCVYCQHILDEKAKQYAR